VAVAIVGATIGNTGILDYEMCFPDSLIGIETGFEAGNRFLEYYFRFQKEKLRSISYASGGQPNIKLETLNAYPLPLPPREEQGELVRRVESFFNLADKIERRVETELLRTEKMTQAILAKAFRGELVPTEAELGRRERRVGG
jgi:type I restriction enzyme, S subunit